MNKLIGSLLIASCCVSGLIYSDAHEKIRENLFQDLINYKISLMDVYAEKLNLIFLIKPTCIADSRVVKPLQILTDEARSVGYAITADKKMQCMLWIKNEQCFFDMSIEDRKKYLEELHDAAFTFACSQIPLNKNKFKMLICAPDILCTFENENHVYTESFMR